MGRDGDGGSRSDQVAGLMSRDLQKTQVIL